MAEHVDWLKSELDRARKELAKKHKRLLEARREHGKAQEAVESLERVLGLATGATTEPSQLPLSAGRGPDGRKLTMADLAEQAIREQGRLSIERLLGYLRKHGKKTSRNSLNTTLNQYRPDRFERDNEGRWYLTKQEASE